jgi:hypothetical protein
LHDHLAIDKAAAPDDNLEYAAAVPAFGNSKYNSVLFRPLSTGRVDAERGSGQDGQSA